MRLILSILFYVLLVFNAGGQVNATAIVDSIKVRLGDQRKVTLELSHPIGTIVQTPSINSLGNTSVEFISQSSWDTISTSPVFRIRKDYLVQIWDSAGHFIPAIPIVYRNTAETDTVFSNPVSLSLTTEPVDGNLRDIKSNELEAWLLEDLFPWAGIAVLLVFLGVLIWYFRKRPAAPAPVQPEKPLCSPQEFALRKLAEISEKKLWQKGQIKAYHSELTYVIREYLEKRFEIKALEHTSDEILAQMKKLGLGSETLDKTRILLQTADLVKFAKAEPEIAFHQNAMSFAVDFIRQTKPALYSTDDTDEDHV